MSLPKDDVLNSKVKFEHLCFHLPKLKISQKKHHVIKEQGTIIDKCQILGLWSFNWFPN